MKKRRIKKRVKLEIIIMISIIVFIIIFCNTLFKKENNEEKIDLSNIVYEKLKNEEIDKDFIIWINDNYKEALSKLNELLKTEEYNKEMWHKVTGYSYIVLSDLYKNKYYGMDNIKILETNETSVLSFVGDVSLAENMSIMPNYDAKGIEGILSFETLKVMKESDLMVANSEFTVSNRGSAMEGKTYTFKAKPERLNLYYDMGIDLVTLANNHVYDYGKDAFLDMLDAFDEYEIPHIGAGHNLDEAKKPYYFIINGYKFAFINASRAEKNRMTPGATDSKEGIFLCYDTTNMINLIKELRDDTDYIITIIHFGRENYHTLEQEQVSSAKAYIDAGSDAVIGHHAHVLQGIEIYKDKPIVYNLGNFLFNEATVDTAIFQIVLSDDGNFEYYMVPALQKDSYTDILLGDEKQRVINDLNSYSINVYIDSDGRIIKK